MEVFEPKELCREAYILASTRQIIVADGKNQPIGILRELLRQGFEASMFYAQKTEDDMVMRRIGRETYQMEGKSNDYSELCRPHELKCIIDQHRQAPLIAVVIPCGTQSIVEERLNFARSIKRQARDIFIFFEGNSLDTDKREGVISRLSDVVKEQFATDKILHKGQYGVILDPAIDIYCKNFNSNIFNQLMIEIVQGSRRT